MRITILFILLISGLCSYGQALNNDSLRKANPDAAFKKETSDLIEDLKEKAQPLLLRIDSMEQVIKNLDDKAMQRRLQELMNMVKNDSLADVYKKMQDFGTRIAVEINKNVAAPNFFYRLDREYYNYITKLEALEKRTHSAIRPVQSTEDCAAKEKFPYDSIYREVAQYNPESERTERLLKGLAKVYKQPVTEEDVDCSLYSFHRIIVVGEQTDVFIRKVWKWGGVFCFHNGGTAITEEEYIALSKRKMEQALNYRKRDPGEK